MANLLKLLKLFALITQEERKNWKSIHKHASFAGSLAPGSLISVYGRNLAYRDDQAAALPLPVDLSGTKVTLNGQPVPLVFASPFQINAQLPYTISGDATLTVSSPNGPASISVNIADAAPGIFFSGAPAILHTNNTLVTPDNPVIAGEFISIYSTGLGRVNGAIAAGQPSPSNPLLAVAAAVEVRLGSATLTPTFAGLAPGYAGLYQVVVRIPPETGSGNLALRIVTRGVSSNTVLLPVGFFNTDPFRAGPPQARGVMDSLRGPAVAELSDEGPTAPAGRQA